MPDAVFHQRIAACEKELCKLKRQHSRLSWLRAAAALAALVFFILGLQWRGAVGFPLCLGAVAAFILLARRHETVERRQAMEENRKKTAEEYLARKGDGWKTFRVTGKEYLCDDFPPGRDLDIFGHRSLYQYLCAAHTVYGRNALAAWLRDGCPLHELEHRQQAVAELAEKLEFSMELQSLGRALSIGQGGQSQTEAADFLEVLRQKERPARIWIGVMWGLPFAVLFFLLSALVGVRPALNLAAGSALIVLQLALTMVRFVAANRLLRPLSGFGARMAPYASLMALIEKESFQSPGLVSLREQIRQNGGAVQALSSLNKMGEAAQMRRNPLALLLLNGLFLWDFHCVERFVRWRERYRESLPLWLEAVGQMEALVSLAILCQVKESTVFPCITETAVPFLSFENLRHPLLEESKAVGSDFHLEHRTCVITGSNMSGKTTFLRSIGISLLLAYAGGPVLAKAFRSARMRVMTAIRVEDSVTQGISSFYAELLRIKTIADAVQEGRPLLALIDEIYKGTNSRDRILGASETLRRLASPHTLTLVTTHDFELCDLEKDEQTDAVNYHFTERYTETEILFDYTIRPGRCTTTNARRLLRMAGILP